MMNYYALMRDYNSVTRILNGVQDIKLREKLSKKQDYIYDLMDNNPYKSEKLLVELLSELRKVITNQTGRMK